MEVPALLLAYKRPKKTEKVLYRLKKCGVTRVFVSVDGPKNLSEQNLTQQIKTVLNQFTDIISNTRVSETNAGCKNGVISGIDWFFDQVEEGIIIEDDCLPSEHLFPYIENMLIRYRNEKKVMMVGGNNPLGRWQTQGGHFFSRIGTIWGWATWKDRWKTFNPDLPEFEKFADKDGFIRSFGPTQLAASRFELTKKSLKGIIDTWDYQWNTHMLMNGGLAVIPQQNLVENIGFEPSATHTKYEPGWIANEVAIEPLKLESRNFLPDREFEMEWELARRGGQKANPASCTFKLKGESEALKLKVLIINSTDDGGGAEKIALTLHHILLELGHDSTLLVEVKKTDLDSVEEIDDWKVQIRTFQPDVIHVHNLHGTQIPISDLSEISNSIPVMLTLHDTWLTTGSNHHAFETDSQKLSFLDLVDWKSEFKLRQSAIVNGNFRFCAPSQWMRETFFNAHGVRPFWVPNAVNVPEPMSLPLPSDRYIVFVSNRPRTNPYKDFETLRKGWILANEELKSDGFDLICLGGTEYQEQHAGFHLHVLERMSDEQVRYIMDNSLFVAQASRQDNAPLAIIEANMAGKPVVASLDGGIPELLSEHELELLHNVGDYKGLASSLIKAARSPFSKSMCNAASVRSMVHTYLGHYFDITDG